MKSSRSSLRQIAARVAVLPTLGKPVIPIFGIVSNKPRAPWTGSLYGGPLEKGTARRPVGPWHWPPRGKRLADAAACNPAPVVFHANAFGRAAPVSRHGSTRTRLRHPGRPAGRGAGRLRWWRRRGRA